MKNYYDILRVRHTATQEQIKDAFIELVSKYHPDIYSGDKNYAQEYTALLTEAYSVLKDPDKRKDYDMTQGFENNTIYASTNQTNNNQDQKNTHKTYFGKNYEQEKSRRYFKNTKIKRSRGSFIKRIFKSKLFYSLLFVFGIEMLIILFIYLR